ncbi:hypothetical protein C6501_00135 [Candidatus Poribacteria bacterium]|nr:MAG: hypothetical protein C6501_00135 [Candidatus Poribacteria bacterium]
MKNVGLLLFPIVFMSLSLHSVSFAQDYIRNYLPESAIARFGKGYVFNFEYSPDGTRLAVASTIGVWLYDTQTYDELHLLTGHTDYVTGVFFSPDSKTLVSESGDGEWSPAEIKLWNISTGELIATLTEQKIKVNYIVFSPDGGTLAIASSDNTIRLWNGVTGELKATFTEHGCKVLKFSSDGSRLVGGSGEAIRFWDVATGELQLTFAAHANSIDALQYSPDGKMIASQGGDNNVCLWNADTGEFLRNFREGTSEISSIDFSRDGKTLAIVSSDETLTLWNSQTGEKIKTITSETKLNFVEHSPDGKTFACDDDEDGAMLLFDAKAGELLHNLKMSGIRTSVNDFRYSPDGRTLAVSNGFDIYFWDVGTGELQNTITGYSEVVGGAIYSPNEKTLASFDYIVRIWDIENHKLQRTIETNSNVSAIAYSPDGKTIGIGTYDNTILLWDVGKWNKRATLKGHTEGVSSVVFSPDGQTLASGSWDGTIRLWDADMGEHLKTFKKQASGVRTVLFSPNGQILASTEDDATIHLWNVATDELVRTIKIEADDVYSIDFSPDGTTLVTADDNGKINFWDVTTGENKEITQSIEKGYYAVLSPDGNTLVSVAVDNISLWDVATGKLLKTLKGHIGAINSVVFSSDGKTLVSGCRDSTVILWDLTE